MKKVFKRVSLVLLFITTINVSGQESEVKNLVDRMFTYAINKDFDALLDITHPKVFDIAPREQMLTLFKTMFEGNGEFSIELPDTKPEYKITELFKGKENNLEYALMSYDMQMKMTFNNQEFDDSTKEMMTNMMKAQGMDVKFISNNTIDATIKNSLVIILREDTTNNEWKLVNYDANSPLFYQIVSSEVIEKAKSYKQDLMLESKKESENN